MLSPEEELQKLRLEFSKVKRELAKVEEQLKDNIKRKNVQLVERERQISELSQKGKEFESEVKRLEMIKDQLQNDIKRFEEILNPITDMLQDFMASIELVEVLETERQALVEENFDELFKKYNQQNL
ncbi:MAG: hypothetical protein AB1589_28100 [Cyanobacteriota bacterium]